MAKKSVHTRDQVAAFLEELQIQSDRGVAIVAAAVLEELLELVILARLIELSNARRDALFGRAGAPLSTFSAKIEMAFALGVISEDARQALDLMRDVRNRFAHRIEALAFDNPAISDLIKTRSSPSVRAANKTVREKFIMSFQGMAVILYGTLAADIRIKSLEETHQEHFLLLMLKAAEISQGIGGE